MKKHFTLLILFITASLAQAQAQDNYDYVDKIAQDACECVQKAKDSNPNLTTEDLGGCLLLSAKDYKAQLSKDYDLDLDSLDGESGEKLGQTIGSRMAFICPTLVASLGNVSDKNKTEEFRILGTIKSIKIETFMVFEIKSEDGKLEKLYWLGFVNSEFDLQNNYEELKEKVVEAIYVHKEVYDARIKEYRVIKVLKKIAVQ